MAIVVASYKCPGYDQSLFGKSLDRFIKAGGVIDQSTGACERERALAMNSATEKMLGDREAFCAETEAALASDTVLTQSLIVTGARRAP